MPTEPPPVHPAHFAVLLAIAKQDRGRLVELFSGEVFDDDQHLWQYLSEHRLWNLFSDLALDGELSDCWSDKYARKLTKRLELNELRRTGMRTALEEIHDAFGEIRLPSILLKGFVYGHLYYPRPNDRHQCDLDLLVKDEDLNAALRCLTQLGFHQKRNRAGVRHSQLATEHAASLYRDGVGIDLHWRLRNLPAYNLDYPRIWRDARRVVIDQRTYWTLSVTDTVASHLIGVAHDIGRGGFSQKGLLDLYLLMQVEADRIDWSLFREDRLRENTWRPCLNVLAILLQTLDCRCEFSQVSELISAESELLAARDDETIYQLLEQKRGSLVSYAWMYRVYPVSWLRDSRWLLRRNLPHPGRVPLAAIRSIRFLWKLLVWSTSSLPAIQRRHAPSGAIPFADHPIRRAA